MIAIPKTFRLGGRTWTVRFEKIVGRDPDILGLCRTHDAEIIIKKGLKPETTQHTFYHELCHATFETLGWDDLSTDEGKVDALGGLLYQFLSSKKGKLTP